MQKQHENRCGVLRTALVVAIVAVLQASMASAAAITTIVPTQGSIHGWTRVSILGEGFDMRGRSNLVFLGNGVDGAFCDPIPNECTSSRIVCLTPPHAATGVMPLQVNSFGFNANCLVAAGCTFEFTLARTPQVTMITPQWAIAPANITVMGSRFSQGDATVGSFDFTMWIGAEERCNLVSTIQYSSFICNLVATRPGALPVTVIMGASGKAVIDPSAATFTLVPSVSRVLPAIGSTEGGQEVTLIGSSFSPDVSSNYVTLHGAPCLVTKATNNELVCITTPHAATTTATRSLGALGSFVLDQYNNLPNGYNLDTAFVGSLQYLRPFATSTETSLAVIATKGCSQCGFRVTAQFEAPETGNYTFEMYGDDWFELWLGNDTNPVPRKRAATEEGSTRTLDVTPFNAARLIATTSCCYWASAAPVALVAGQTYWFRSFVKNGYGALGLSMRVTFPNGTRFGNAERFLRASDDWVSPVRVTVNDIAAQPQDHCLNFGTCNFNYVSTATATITSVSPSTTSALSEITIIGTGFDTTTTKPSNAATVCADSAFQCGNGGCACPTEGECQLESPVCAWTSGACGFAGAAPQCFQWSRNDVEINGQPCNVTFQSATELRCTVPFATAGAHEVLVWAGANGRASGSHFVTLPASVTAIYPAAGSITGGNLLTIAGRGFNTMSGVTSVSLGGTSCRIRSITTTRIACLVPALAAGSHEVIVRTQNSRLYTLANSYQFDAQPVRPGTTVESTEVTLTPTSAHAGGDTTVYVTLPTDVSLSSATEVSVMLAETLCNVLLAQSNTVWCVTTAPLDHKLSATQSWLSFVDKYGQGQSIELPNFRYYPTVLSVTPVAISPLGAVFNFHLSTMLSTNEVTLRLNNQACEKLTIYETYGTCIMPAKSGNAPRLVLDSYTFLGDGNPLTNPLNFVSYTPGVTVDSAGVAMVPAGGYLMSKRSFKRPFAFKAMIKPALSSVKYSTTDRSVVIRTCVQENTLSTSGYYAAAGGPNATFRLIGSASSTGTTAITPDFSGADLDPTQFQEHRMELWNTYIRYYVNDVLIYHMADTGLEGSGKVGTGFSSQAVYIESMTVESLDQELLQVNISGSPIGSPVDVFYLRETHTSLPSAMSVSQDTDSTIRLSRTANVDATIDHRIVTVPSISSGLSAKSVNVCPSLRTETNPVTLAVSYLCTPTLLPAGTYFYRIVNLVGASVLAYEFNVWARVDRVMPSTIAVTGARLTIVGFGFTSGTRVTIGGDSCEIHELNTTLLTCNAPERAPGAASIIVTVGTSTLNSLSVTYGGASPFNVTAVNPILISQYTTVTITGTGFTSAAKAYIGPYAMHIASVSATNILVRADNAAGSSLLVGQQTIRVVQGNAQYTTTVTLRPWVYTRAFDDVDAAGGSTAALYGVSFHAFSATPTSSLDTSSGISTWDINDRSQYNPQWYQGCTSPVYGPIPPLARLWKTYANLPAHSYVRIRAVFASNSEWWWLNLAVDEKVVVTTNTHRCNAETVCPRYTCMQEATITFRHSAAEMLLSLYSIANIEFSFVSLNIDFFDSLPSLAILINGTHNAVIETIAPRFLTFTVPAITAAITPYSYTFTVDGTDRCATNVCKLNVLASPSFTHATIDNFDAPAFAPLFPANATYHSQGTDLTGAFPLTSANGLHPDSAVVGFEFTVGSMTSTFSINLEHASGVKIGYYTEPASRVHGRVQAWVNQANPTVVPGDVLRVEYHTELKIVVFLVNGKRDFAVANEVRFWPLRLVVTNTAAITNLKWVGNAPEDRIVLFGGAGVTPPATDLELYNSIAPCRTLYTTNGHVSCFVPRSLNYVAGSSVTFTSKLNGASQTVTLPISPSIQSLNLTEGGQNGGLWVAIRGGAIPTTATTDFCTDITVVSPTTIACKTASTTGLAAVDVSFTSNSATSFAVTSTALSVDTAAVITAALLFNVNSVPTITSVTVGTANTVTLIGTSFPLDSAVSISTGVCTVTSATATEVVCTLSGQRPGDYTVFTTSPTVGVSNTQTFTLTLTVTAITPTTFGVGGMVVVTLTGTGFGTVATGVSVKSGAISLCSSLTVADTTILCTTVEGEFAQGTLSVEVGAAQLTTTQEVTAASSVPSPTVTSVTPTLGLGGTRITIAGTNLDGVRVKLGATECTTVTVTATQVVCDTPATMPAGAVRVRAIGTTAGSSVEVLYFTALLTVRRVSPGQGSKHGGQLVTVLGQGFSDVGQTITVGGSSCAFHSATATELTCYSTVMLEDPTMDVVVKVADATLQEVTAATAYVTSASLTATITSATPASSSAAGMELLTIVGTGFGTDASVVKVFLGTLTTCNIESVSDTEIVCRTVAAVPTENLAVNVLLSNEGYAAGAVTHSLRLNIDHITGSGLFSVEGGGVVTIVGEGFWTFADPETDWRAAYYSVLLNDWLPCAVVSSTSTNVVCTLPPSPRPTTRIPTLSTSYVAPPTATMSVSIVANQIHSTGTATISYDTTATPTITAVTPAGASVVATSALTITGTGFATTGNSVHLGASVCDVLTESETEITCRLNEGIAGSGLVKVLVPGKGYASTVRSCTSGFMDCNGNCLTDEMCRVDAWGTSTCADLNLQISGETFCHALGGGNSVNQPFLTDTNTAFNLNCPMYSCEGNDCNTTLSIGGHGAVVSSCGADPNGFVRTFRSTVTAIAGAMSSVAGGKRITITGTGFPTDVANIAVYVGSAVGCVPVTATATQIVCETLAHEEAIGLALTVATHGTTADCAANICGTAVTYAATTTPTVTNLALDVANGFLTVTGTNFPDTSTSADATITIGSTACSVGSRTTTSVTCQPARTIASGAQSFQLHFSAYGYANGTATLTIPFAVSSFTPSSGSLNGGTLVTILGYGFTNAVTSTIGSCNAVFVSLTAGALVVRTTACAAATAAVVNVALGTANAATVTARFSYAAADTAAFTGTLSTNRFTLTLSDYPAALTQEQLTLTLGTATCTITSFALPAVTCDAPAVYADGTFDLVAHIAPGGYATNTAALAKSYTATVTAITPALGYQGGGQTVTITGTNFGTTLADVSVEIDGIMCHVSVVTTTTIECVTGPTSSSGAKDVVVTVTSPFSTATTPTEATKTAAYTYQADSPTVTAVRPTRGSTAGGTRLTIMGSSLHSGLEVRIAGVVCTQSESEQTATDNGDGTVMFCTTGAFQPMYVPALLHVVAPSNAGEAYNVNTFYQYIDLWSRWTTWGNSPPPQFGDSAVIQEGQVIMVDYSPPRFFLIVVMGTLIFDNTTDITVECTYIMINYGKLVIGTPEYPYTKKATIRLWGNRLTPEIPVHGSKVIALRYGAIDMHGIPRTPTWTRIAATAVAGASSITVKGPVDWKAGEFIVIAPTDFDPMEGEVRMIVAVENENTDVVTLHLELPLTYLHFGERQCYGEGETNCVDEIAEVGLLTRNIVVEGDRNSMALGFGGTMFLMPMGHSDDMYCRLSFIELRHVGQQYIVGRYPVHFHVTGVLANSYVNGTSVHDSLNRAYSVHAISNNTYVNNVAYNIQGHAFFVEDGSERHNIIRNNLVVQNLATTSNLNSDLTPACFWLAGPMNYLDDNAAAGSHNFGIWYAPFDPHSTGPSHSTTICPFGQALGSCNNNVAHSNLWHGFHIFKLWLPREQECNANSPAVPAVIRNLVVYKNQIWGATMGNMEVGRVGAIRFDNLVSADNGFENADGAQFWIEHLTAPNMTCGITNSLLIAHTANNPYRRWEHRRGINLPQEDNFFAENVTFVNFDGENHAMEPQAWAMFRSLCFPYGWEAMTKGLTFIASPNRVLFRFPHHGIINDADGTLSGVAGSQVVPNSPINQGATCTDYDHANAYPALVCPNNYKIRRFGVSTSNSPQLNQLWRVEDRLEINYQIDRSYVFTAPINREINVTFLTMTTPNWGWRFGGTTFMQPGDKALFTAYFPHAPYSVPTRFDSRAITAYANPVPTLANTTSLYSYDNISTKLTTLLVWPTNRFYTAQQLCPPEGCPQIVASYIWNAKCHNALDTAAWTDGAIPTAATDVTIDATRHVCLGYNATIPRFATRYMELSRRLGRTCTSATNTVEYNFNSLTILGALSLTNDNCPCVGGTININIHKYLQIIGGGFLLGNATHPITDCTVNVNMRDIPWTSGNLAAYRNSVYGFRGFTLESGLISIHAATPTVLWTRLRATAAAGTATLQLETAVSWSVGDVIAIAATTRDKLYTKAETRVDESEQHVIASISTDGRTITLRSALRYRHYGATPQTLNGNTYSIGAEVMLLSRKVVFGSGTDTIPLYQAGWRMNIGCTAANNAACAASRQMSAIQWGSVKIDGALFKDGGQSSTHEGAITFDGLVNGTDARGSYVANCSFWRSFNSPVFIRQTTTGLVLRNNMMYDNYNDGIRVASSGNTIIGNVAIGQKGFDPLCDPLPYNIFWSCRTGLFRIHAGNVVQFNVAASAAGAGFVTEGDVCGTDENWKDNVAHSTRDGVLVADEPAEPEWFWTTHSSPTSCRRIRGITTYWSSDHGLIAWYVQGNVSIDHFVSVDNQVGSHVQSVQTGQFQNYVPFVDFTDVTYSNRWNTADFACRASFNTVPVPCRGTTLDSKFWCKFFSSTAPTALGDVGAMEALFTSTALGVGPTHGEHKNFWQEMDSYSTVGGQSRYLRVHFANFDGLNTCGHRSVAFFQNIFSNDTFHQHTFQEVTWTNTASGGKFFPWRMYGEVTQMPTDSRTRTYFLDFDNYIHGGYWPDSPNKQLLIDLDGSFTGTGNTNTYVVASETLARTSKFAEIGYDGQAFLGKTLSQSRDGCVWTPSMNSFVCDNRFNFMSLNIDSLADDALTRRAGPVVLCRGDGMIATNGWPLCDGGAIDFASGPVMKGKTQRATLDRLSRWRFWAENGSNNTLSFRGAPPSWIRLQLQDYEYLNAPSVGITLNLRYHGLNANSRVGVYVNGRRISAVIGYTNPWQMSPPATWPSSTDEQGTNFMNLYTDSTYVFEDGSIGFKKNILSLTLRAGSYVDLIQEPIVQVNMAVSMTVEQFFQNKDTFIAALAQVLNIPSSRIKIANVVAGTTRRRVGTTQVEVQIEQPPSNAPPVDGEAIGSQPPVSQSNDFSDIMQSLNEISENTTILTEATGGAIPVASLSSTLVTVESPRPEIAIASGTPYISLNASNPTNTVYFDSSDVLTRITNWIETNMIGAPYNTTGVDSTLAIGNLWTNVSSNVTQFTITFGYANNTYGYAALTALYEALETNSEAVLPGYTIHQSQFASNNYVPDMGQDETPGAPTTVSYGQSDNISKFAIGIGIGVAVVLVLGGAVLYYVLVVRPKLLLKRRLQLKAQLKETLDRHNSNGMEMFPTVA